MTQMKFCCLIHGQPGDNYAHFQNFFLAFENLCHFKNNFPTPLQKNKLLRFCCFKIESLFFLLKIFSLQKFLMLKITWGSKKFSAFRFSAVSNISIASTKILALQNISLPLMIFITSKILVTSKTFVA